MEVCEGERQGQDWARYEKGRQGSTSVSGLGAESRTVGARSGLGTGVTKVTVMVEGVAREGVIDAEGRIQVAPKGPEYFSIASEEVDQGQSSQRDVAAVPPLPSFGRPETSLDPGSPFNPKARSPFQHIPPPPPPPRSCETVNVGEPAWVPPRPLGSPPRSRSQSPVTPRRRPALSRLVPSPATPQKKPEFQQGRRLKHRPVWSKRCRQKLVQDQQDVEKIPETISQENGPCGSSQSWMVLERSTLP